MSQRLSQVLIDLESEAQSVFRYITQDTKQTGSSLQNIPTTNGGNIVLY